jgi:hypothetical protein
MSAFLSGSGDDKSLIDAFAKGEDIHRHTAGDIFNVPHLGEPSSQRSLPQHVLRWGLGGAGHIGPPSPSNITSVIPAKAGIHFLNAKWFPAFAGTTVLQRFPKSPRRMSETHHPIYPFSALVMR